MPQNGDRPGEVGLDRWFTAGLAILFLGAASLYFLQTRDITGSILLALLAIGIGLVGWIWQDADRLDLPRLPWAIAVLLVPGLGLVGYLVAREVRRSDA